MSIFGKIKKSFTKTSEKISSSIDRIFFKKKLDIDSINNLEELLIESDMNINFVKEIIKKFSLIKFDKSIEPLVVKEYLSQMIIEIMEKANLNSDFNLNDKPTIILISGVNGSGKTTTIGKLASYYGLQDKKVVIAACDTFRAGAMSQLELWANMSGAILIKGTEKSDPASVAYRAVEYGINNNADIVLIDTAGRLHNHKNLMDELAKITKVIKKLDVTAPHYSLLVLDSTIGQNLYKQVEEFKNVANINGLIITKLDGTAKGGAIVGITDKFKIPIYFMGLGEKIDDLRIFNISIFVKNLLGL
jgi:fused signal recognition particle receptor